MKRQPANPLPKALSVGELARRSGTSVATIHFYERKGLISGWRSAGNQRRYERATLRRVALIRTAQRIGISLAEVKRKLAGLPQERTPNASDWAALARGWKEELEERIRLLVALRDRLDGCIGCGCLSMENCPLRNPDDVVAGKGAGPQLLTGDTSNSAETILDSPSLERPPRGVNLATSDGLA